MGYTIRLYGDNGKLLSISIVYGDMVSMLSKFAKKYEESGIIRITLRVYSMDEKVIGMTSSTEDIVSLLEEVICVDFLINSTKTIHYDDIRHDERSYNPQYDDSQKGEKKDKWPIYIPSHNEDRFMREGYYGGHVDGYIPISENLHYYDVNSFYPVVMIEIIMPTGKPV
ncbi:hypothetical protein BC332_24193 [Capsicum chinense]|nr:hypothetical protein BC332_24193 [Capsicum chinense]